MKLRNTEHRLCKWQTKTQCPLGLVKAKSAYVKVKGIIYIPILLSESK